MPDNDDNYNPVKPLVTCVNGHEYPAMAGLCPVCEVLDSGMPDPVGLPESIQRQVDAARAAQPSE